jgi:hypothetical protein
MRAAIRFIFGVAGLLLTIQAFNLTKNAFYGGQFWLQNQTLEWWVGAAITWSIYWWAGQTPK